MCYKKKFFIGVFMVPFIKNCLFAKQTNSKKNLSAFFYQNKRWNSKQFWFGVKGSRILLRIEIILRLSFSFFLYKFAIRGVMFFVPVHILCCYMFKLLCMLISLLVQVYICVLKLYGLNSFFYFIFLFTFLRLRLSNDLI